jgi:hypothetical protein
MQDGSQPERLTDLTERYIARLEAAIAGLRQYLSETEHSKNAASPSPTSSPPDLLETRSKPGSITLPKEESLAYLHFTIDGPTPLSARELSIFKRLSEQASLNLCSALVEHRFGPLEVKVVSRSGGEAASVQLRVSSLGIVRLPSPAPFTQLVSSENSLGDLLSSTT